MNILFVHSMYDIFLPAKPLWVPTEIQYGISYISSLLKKHGHSTRLVILSRMLGRENEKRISEYVNKFSPQVICFTAVSSEYRFIAYMAKYIKGRYPDIYLLIGGHNASLNPEEVILDDFDALCVGEGEYPTLELVSQLEKGALPSAIPNLWIKHDGEIEKNPTRPFLQDLDNLPFPDKEMWQGWIGGGESQASVLLGRGCPFECTYCCNHVFKKLAKGPYIRFRSPDNILEEIKDILAKFPHKRDFYLEVEIINLDQKWALELCSKLKSFNETRDQPLSFGSNFRITPNAKLENLFAIFKESNFKFLSIGLESGSERVRREILKRYYSNQDVLNTVKLAHRYGLKTNLYNLVGIPGETAEDFNETVKVNRMCLPDNTATSIFYPYPGTELYRLCKKQGLLKKDRAMGSLERCEATLNLPTFSKREIQKSFEWFDYNVYKRYKPLYKILQKVLIAKFKSTPKLHYAYRKLTYAPFFRWLKNVLLHSW